MEESVLQRMADLLRADTLEWHMNQGGYPDQIAVIAGEYICIASADENGEPGLLVYDKQTAEAWYDALQAYRQENPDEELWECLSETNPGEPEWETPQSVQL